MILTILNISVEDNNIYEKATINTFIEIFVIVNILLTIIFILNLIIHYILKNIITTKI